MDTLTPVLLVTANVGSIFENPDVMLNIWVHEFLQFVSNSEAKFIALHCQEVGGKNYEIRMQYVQQFIQLLTLSKELAKFDKMEIFIDEDFSQAESFTALGSFYFVHEDITNAQIWNFETMKLTPIRGKNVHAGNIENIPTKEKSKFPQNFFPECKWSRKGYLRTRWCINDSIFDLVNIHLFHDASNFIAMQTFPSAYTIMRQKALQYTLNRFYNYEDGTAPFFLFGDFNFRVDTQGVIKKLVKGLNECKQDGGSNNESPKLEYKDDASEIVFTIGKKEFNHTDHQNVFIGDAGEWLKEFDREVDEFKEQLYEFPITFAPSYPYEENYEIGSEYMKTRCPAWCDRVLLSVSARQLLHKGVQNEEMDYGIIGKDICMGDHKPVYLRLNLINGAGMVLAAELLPSKINNLCPACKLTLNSLYINNQHCSSKACYCCNNSPCSSLRNYYNDYCFCGDFNNKQRQHHLLARSSKSVDPIFSQHHQSPLSIVEFPNNLDDPIDETEKSTDNLQKINHNNLLNESDSDLLSKTSSLTHAEIHDYPYDKLSNKFSALDEISKVKRVHSASLVVDNKNAAALPDFRKGSLSICLRCNEIREGRIRSASVSERLLNWYSSSRVRLKSDPELKISLPRIESHHSSSDEEWFEEVLEEDASPEFHPDDEEIEADNPRNFLSENNDEKNFVDGKNEDQSDGVIMNNHLLIVDEDDHELKRRSSLADRRKGYSIPDVWQKSIINDRTGNKAVSSYYRIKNPDGDHQIIRETTV